MTRFTSYHVASLGIVGLICMLKPVASPLGPGESPVTTLFTFESTLLAPASQGHHEVPSPHFDFEGALVNLEKMP